MYGEFLYNPDGVGLHAHAGSIAQSSGGDLFATWYAYPGHHDYQNGKIIFTRRLEGATTWERARALEAEYSSSTGNPVLWIDERTGRLWLWFVVLKGDYWTDAIVCASTSDDRGEHWSEAYRTDLPVGIMIRHAPLQLPSGDLLLPAYDERALRAVMYIGSPLEWKEVYRFDSNVIQPALVDEGGGKVTAFFRPTEDPAIVWRSGSTTGGQEWSRPVQTSLLCPLSGIAACRVGSQIIVVHNPARVPERFPLHAVISSDGGITWSPGFPIDICHHEVSYPSFISAGDGTVHGVYTFNRRMIRYVEIAPEELT